MIESFKQGPPGKSQRLNKIVNEVNRLRALGGGVHVMEGGTWAGRRLDLKPNTIVPHVGRIPAGAITTPVAWYLFNGGEAVDVSGHGFDGAFGGNANASSDAAFFNGDNDYVDCNDTLTTDFLATGPITVMAWIMPYSDALGNDGRIISNGKFEIYLDVFAQIMVVSDGSTVASSGGWVANAGKWVHVCVTRQTTYDAAGAPNGSITNIYINGVLSGSANQSTGTPAAGTTNIYLGNNTGLTKDYHGFIDDVRVYSGILSTSVIKQLYQSSISKSYQHVTQQIGSVHVFEVVSMSLRWLVTPLVTGFIIANSSSLTQQNGPIPQATPALMIL
jgi:hypothetical protein